MKRKFWPGVLIGSVLGLVLLGVVSAAWAASPAATYDLTWYSIDGGGGSVAGGVYSLGGTVGQADAGVLQGGVYSLNGGFWAGAAVDFRTYLPLVARQ